jgi:hypothetical protein
VLRSSHGALRPVIMPFSPTSLRWGPIRPSIDHRRVGNRTDQTHSNSFTSPRSNHTWSWPSPVITARFSTRGSTHGCCKSLLCGRTQHGGNSYDGRKIHRPFLRRYQPGAVMRDASSPRQR